MVLPFDPKPWTIVTYLFPFRCCLFKMILCASAFFFPFGMPFPPRDWCFFSPALSASDRVDDACIWFNRSGKVFSNHSRHRAGSSREKQNASKISSSFFYLIHIHNIPTVTNILRRKITFKNQFDKEKQKRTTTVLNV